jgi:hypothetical protein
VQVRHPGRRTWAAAAVIACACLFHAVGLRASVVVPLSLSQLVEAADLIVDATVEDVRAVEGTHGIERLVQLRVGATWKGTTDRVVYLRLAGGQIGRTETRVAGVPTVEPGDRLAWFLVAHPRGGYSVLGLHQGAMRAVAGPDGQARVLAPARVAGARGDVARVPRAIDALAADVRTLAGSGAER